MTGAGGAGGAAGGGGAVFAAQPAPRTAIKHPTVTRRILVWYLFRRVEFRYLAIEGPPGLGKTALAQKLAARLDATVVLDEGTNPFLAEFYGGRSGAALEAQRFLTHARHRQ